jgi:hypothetical protein
VSEQARDRLDAALASYDLNAVEVVADLLAELEAARAVMEAARVAEAQASKAHDAIYREPVDREAANDAIWAIHNALRPALAKLAPPGEEG